MHISRGRRHWVNNKTLFCLFLFMFVFLYCIVFVFCTCIYLYAFVLHWMHVRMIICFAMWSFALLCDHCSHFYMTVLVYDQVTHMFHIMFTWSQFTCYIILVLLLLALPWESNVFCASVSGYKYICSKCILASHHSEGEKILSIFSLYCLNCYLAFYVLYPCCFCKLLGFVIIICRLYGLYYTLCNLYILLNQYF